MNQNFTKQVIENGGSLHPIIIPSILTGGTGLTNPSIFVKDGNVQLNLRHVQYTLWHNENEQKFPNHWGPLCYLNPEDDLTLTTNNYLLQLESNTLEVESYTKIDTSKLDVTPIWEFVGLEDGRLVEWDGKTWLCGVRRDTTTNGEGRMELSEIKDGKEIARYRIEPPTPSYCEKNWMPILDMPFHFVKWTNPTEIVKVDINTLTSEVVAFNDSVQKLPRDIRGGSQVITYGDYRIALTHEVDLWKNEQNQKDTHYYHRFIVWDKDWNIINTSEEFNFLHTHVEFSCGMAIHDGNILIPFGFQDNTAYLLTIPLKWFMQEFLGIEEKIQKPNYVNFKPTIKLLQDFVNNPLDEKINFDLAEWYFNKGQTASALSLYLRTAEYGSDTNLIYLSLIQVGNCLRQQGRRNSSAVTSFMNAISFQPKRPEAYLALSYHYESFKEWIQSYTFAQLAYEYKGSSTLHPEYIYKFQIAVTSWWVGKSHQSREGFFELAYNYADIMSQEYVNLVQTNITSLGSGPDPFLPYTALDFPKLKYQFKGSKDIKKNYSQTFQDMFVLSMLDGKTDGTYLEIGAADPFKGNNTALLEELGWTGRSLEILPHEVEKFKSSRKNEIILCDATKFDYSYLEGYVDYLQVDCEPPSITLEILKMLPFDKCDFGVITFEHDYYADITKSYRQLSREFLTDKGYILVAGNIAPDNTSAYEDWWVHPKYINSDILEKMESDPNTIKNAKFYMLNK